MKKYATPSIPGRLTPKQADRFAEHLVGAFRDSLDELIIEAEWREDRWVKRIADMILLHVRRTGREPNTVWLPRRFAHLVSWYQGTRFECHLPTVETPITVVNVEVLQPPHNHAVNPEDLAVGRIVDRGSRAVVGAHNPWIETFFVERHVETQTVR